MNEKIKTMTSSPLFKRAMLCLALSALCHAGLAETFSAQVAIVDHDLAQARQQAIRQILLEASLHSDVEIRSATSVINYVPAEASLLTSRTWLQSFAIVAETMTEHELRLTANIEMRNLPNTNCQPLIATRNIGASLRIREDLLPDPESRLGARLLLDEIRRLLVSRYPALPGDNELVFNPPYLLSSTLQVHGEGAARKELLRFSLGGADEGLIASLSYPVDLKQMVTRQRESLGYANLVKSVLSREGSGLAQKVSEDLVPRLQCLPVVARVPEPIEPGVLLIESLSGLPARLPSVAFFATEFPVQIDGSINLLRLNGQLEIIGMDNGRIYLKLPKKNAGQPYPVPGNYILLQ